MGKIMGEIRKLCGVIELHKSQFFMRHAVYFALLLISAISFILYPNILRIIINEGVASGDLELMKRDIALMVAVSLLAVVTDYLSNLCYSGFLFHTYLAIKKKFFSKIIYADNQFYKSSQAGDLYTCLKDDLLQISQVITVQIPYMVKDILILLIVAVFLIVHFGLFGTVIVILSLLVVLCQKYYGVKINAAAGEQRRLAGQEAAYHTEILSHLENVQMMGHTGAVYKKFAAYAQTVTDFSLKFQKIRYSSSAVSFLLNTVIMILIVAIGSFQTVTGALEVGTFFSLVMYSQRLVGPLNALISAYIKIREVNPLAGKTKRFLDLAEPAGTGAVVPQDPLTHISCRHVSFSYPFTRKQVLADYCCEFSYGDIVGITGANGVGKTTLIKLILQVLRPDMGKIVLNETYEIGDVNDDYLHKYIGYMPQNPYLLSGTLREALNPLDLQIADETMISVIKAVGLEYELFGCTLDFYITENMLNLSGGEIQKIGLCRLLLEDKEWMILDEPTSAMDEISEWHICSYLKTAFVGKTVIVITHRPEILKICNRIIDMRPESNAAIKAPR